MAGPFTDCKVVFTELFTMIRGVRCLRVVESPEAMELRTFSEQEEKEAAKSVKRRTTWAAVATVTALAMLTAAAMIVDGCACFVPGTSLQPCGTFTPRVTPIPHDPPADARVTPA